MNVVHAVPQGTQAFAARSIETGEEAVIITTPVKVERISVEEFYRQGGAKRR